MRVLVVNSGSSSLKLRVVEDGAVTGTADLGADAATNADELSTALSHLPEPDAVGHRIVHGGTRFPAAVVVDAHALREIDALSQLAPLHQPRAVAALETCRALLPQVPTVACFDTAFHHTLPPAAATYAVPATWREQYGVRKYGFHGLSHAYVADRMAALLPDVRPLRIVSCHLGAGASATAINGGLSVDTTMGFTPLDGLVMATRSGSVDPGLILWLEQEHGMPAAEVADALLHRSGLLALAGTADMRAVVEGSDRGDADCQLALGVYCHRVRGSIAALAAAMQGLDVLVFTGGIGENSAAVRAGATAGLQFLGLRLDAAANTAAVPDAEIGEPQAAGRVFVVASHEELRIAREVEQLLDSSG